MVWTKESKMADNLAMQRAASKESQMVGLKVNLREN